MHVHHLSRNVEGFDDVPHFLGALIIERNQVPPFGRIPVVSTLRCFSICGQIVGRQVQKAKNAAFAVNLRQ